MTQKIQTIEDKYTTFKESVLKLKALRDEKEEELQEKLIEYDTLTLIKTNMLNARDLLEQCNITSREFIKDEVEQLVTKGLRAVFDDPLVQFNIEFVEKRNQTEALFHLTTEGDDTKISGDIITTYGGGVVDIISISLRIITMELLGIQGPFILDEPGKNISANYIENFSKFLAGISKAFNRQIIMITHNNTLTNYSDNLIKVTQQNGISKINV